jgi:uncharacterized protein (UPF0276 family)
MSSSLNQTESLPRDPAGLGLRFPYHQEIIETKPDLGWLEIHPENYFGGGEKLHFLEQIRELYPISFHAVGLSLGSTEPVDQDHLKNIKSLIDRFEPFQFSDHVSWSASGNAHLNDLLPLPYTQESLDTLARNIETVQNAFGAEILVENPSTYLSFKEGDMAEPEFLNALAKRTGCSLLLDVNNIYVQAINHGFDAKHYIDTINTDIIKEIHLAGHLEETEGNERLLIDTHGDVVCHDVWDLYAYTLQKHGSHLTLIEWDQNYPDFSTLMGEVKTMRSFLEGAKDSDVA